MEKEQMSNGTMTPDGVRDALKAHGLSYKDAAGLFGVSKRTVTRWVAGQTEIPAWLSLALAGLRWRAVEEQVRAHEDRRAALLRAMFPRPVTERTVDAGGLDGLEAQAAREGCAS
jgi:DNA-binding transcriptional regulator YdaS (Cro superfamily)